MAKHSIPVTLIVIALALAGSQTRSAEGEDHSAHGGHHGHHNMSQEDFARLREVVDQYKPMTDDEIMQSMSEMPGNYDWYVSDSAIRGKTGVLVLAHGSGEYGDKIFASSLEPLASEVPLSLGFGMAMMGSAHLQTAVSNLEAAGADKIIIVPAALSRNGSVYRQWSYIFDQRIEPAYLEIPRVESTAELVMGSVMGGHPMAAEIVLDHAREISKDPANESLLIVGHGPEDITDNQRELSVLRRQAKRIRTNSDFADVRAINLQDDAPPHIRDGNVAILRAWIGEAREAGRTPLIVGFLMSTRGIHYKFAEDLKGLDYRLSERGMSSHPGFTAWIEASVAEQG